MKTTILKYLTICGTALAALSCVKAEVLSTDIVAEGDMGSLVISQVGVVMEPVEKPHVSTRAVSPADFDVTITRTRTREVAWSGKYSTIPAQIDLFAGDYELYVESHDPEDVAWSNPANNPEGSNKTHYSTRREFSIVKDQTTTLDDVVCKVTSILVVVKFTDRMEEWMDTDCGVGVKIGNCGPLAYDVATQDKEGAFRAEQESQMLHWDFAGTIDGEWIAQGGDIPNVKAGQRHTLTYDIVVDATGTSEFPFTVTVDVESYDVNLNIPIGDEEIIAPLYTLEMTSTHDLGAPNVIYTEQLPGKMSFGIEASEGIAGMRLKVAMSDGRMGYTLWAGRVANVDLINPTETDKSNLSSASNFNWPIPENIADNTEYELDITNIFKFLASYVDADDITLDITIEVTDGAGNTIEKTIATKFKMGAPEVYTLQITGDGIGATKVVTVSEINAGTAEVKVNIAASMGIKEFKVNFSSTNSQFNMAGETIGTIDLVNDEGGAVAELAEGNVILPSGDQVKDATEIPFDISGFLPMMLLLIEDGEYISDFALTITDNGDHTINPVIKLQIINE